VAGDMSHAMSRRRFFNPGHAEWSTVRAQLARTSGNEIADELLAVAPVTWLVRMGSAAPEMANALGYDTQATPQEQKIGYRTHSQPSPSDQ
jgi:hypothetical protein